MAGLFFAENRFHRVAPNPENMQKPLQVMKFGGTSVGDASCIRRAAQIVREAAGERPVTAVVSAMSGVTNRLIQAARASEAGDLENAIVIFGALRKQHAAAVDELVGGRDKQEPLKRRLEKIFDE